MSYIKHFSQKLIRHPVFSGSYVNKLRDSFSITKRRTYKYHIISMRRNSSMGVTYSINHQATRYQATRYAEGYAEGYKTEQELKKESRESYKISYVDDNYIYIRWNNGSIDKYHINDPLPDKGEYPEK